MTDTFATIAADYRQLARDAQQLRIDHSAAAIFRRAWRAALADAQRSRAWKARALGLNPAAAHNGVALAGMTPLQVDDCWHLAVAWPQPRHITDRIDDVIVIDPQSDTAQVLGDHGVRLIAPARECERVEVFASPKAWARSVALYRLEQTKLRAARARALQAEPTWDDEPPIALMLAPPKRVPWPMIRARVIDVPTDLRATVNRAVFDQARLPRIEGRA